MGTLAKVLAWICLIAGVIGEVCFAISSSYTLVDTIADRAAEKKALKEKKWEHSDGYKNSSEFSE